MKTLVRTILLSLLGFGIAVNIAYAKKPGTEVPGGFLGFSDSNQGTVNGSVGRAGMDALCEATFPGQNARMCTSEEIIKSPVSAQTGTAWVHPTYVFVTGTSNSIRVDASGVATASLISSDNLSCSGWRLDTGSGLALNSNLSFEAYTCDTVNQVACCN